MPRTEPQVLRHMAKAARQIGWLPPIEDRLGDIRREIAEADEPREIRPAGPFLLDAVSCPNSPETELPPRDGRRRVPFYSPLMRVRARARPATTTRHLWFSVFSLTGFSD